MGVLVKRAPFLARSYFFTFCFMQIKRFTPTSHKIKAVVYGPSGVGKTTFGATCPKPLFLAAESGLLSIASHAPDYVEIRTLQDLREALVYLKSGKHEYETAVIDSITEISEIIKQGIEKKSGKAMTLQDFGTLSKEIRNILRAYRDLPMHVVFIALEKIEKDEEKVIRYLPDLSGKSASEIAQFMDIVGYITIDQATGERRIITNTSAKTLSKDRTGKIGNNTDADFSQWIEAVKGLVVTKEEEVVYTTPAAPQVATETETEEPAAEETPTETPEAPKAPTAKKAPAPKISDKQIEFAKGLLAKLTEGMDEATVASKLRGSIKVSAEVEIPAGLVSTDAILGSLDKDQATKVIDFLKSKTEPKAAAPVAPAATEEAPKAAKTSEEMVEDLKKKTAKTPENAAA